MFPSIEHDRTGHRFLTRLDGVGAELAYHLEQGRMVIDHVGVPPAIGGRGVAAELVRTALEHARASGMAVVTACTYSQAYVRRHPQYADLLAG
jgi:predicted GNAT family acetyltransferase